MTASGAVVRASDAPFVVSLRTRPEPVRVAPADAAGTLAIRVQLAEAWDAVRVDALPTSTVGEVVAAVGAVLLPGEDVAAGYVTKLRGADVRDDRVSLREAGVVAGSTLLLMARRRRPVR